MPKTQKPVTDATKKQILADLAEFKEPATVEEFAGIQVKTKRYVYELLREGLISSVGTKFKAKYTITELGRKHIGR